MDTAGLHLDQGPPLSVPVSFFALAPLAMAAAGALLLIRGPALFGSPWAPGTLALTHLFTLGFLSAVMLGALTQLVPVIGGARVPALGLLRLVPALLVLGVGAFAAGLLGPWPAALRLAQLALGAAILLAALPIAVALRPGRAAGATVQAMRLALLGLFGLAALGLLLAEGHHSGRFPGPRLPWMQVHLVLALCTWAGSLLAGVSWQLVPMFWMARPVPGSVRALVLGGIGLGALGGLLALVLDGPVALAALPAVVAAFVLHPLSTLYGLRSRRRARPDASLRWWILGLCLLPLGAVVGLAALVLPGARLPLLAGFLLLWGGMGTLVLGTLSKILPFLRWFHRYSALVGKVKVPSMRQLLPDAWVARGLWLHGAGLVLGALAAVLGGELLPRLFGGLLLVEGGLVAAAMIGVLRR